MTMDEATKKTIGEIVATKFAELMPTFARLFAEPKREDDPKPDPRDAEIARLNAELEASKAALNARSATEDEQAAAAFAERCIKEKRAFPSQRKALDLTAKGRTRAELDALFAEMKPITELDGRSTPPVEEDKKFAEGDGGEEELASIFDRTKGMHESSITFYMSEHKVPREQAMERVKGGFVAAFRNDIKGARALVTK